MKNSKSFRRKIQGLGRCALNIQADSAFDQALATVTAAQTKTLATTLSLTVEHLVLAAEGVGGFESFNFSLDVYAGTQLWPGLDAPLEPGGVFFHQTFLSAGARLHSGGQLSFSGGLLNSSMFAPVTTAGGVSTTSLLTPQTFTVPLSFEVPGGINRLYLTTITSGTGETFAAAIPEPSSWTLLALGLTGLAALRRRSAARRAFL